MSVRTSHKLSVEQPCRWQIADIGACAGNEAWIFHTPDGRANEPCPGHRTCPLMSVNMKWRNRTSDRTYRATATLGQAAWPAWRMADRSGSAPAVFETN